MKASQEYIHSALETETRRFCTVELAVEAARSVPSTPYYHDTDPARATNCGVATGFVQQQLFDRHDIATTRLRGAPALMPKAEFGARFDHVILRHDDFLLDPTYGQLARLAGLDRRHPDTRPEHYPDALSLVVDINNPDAALEPLTESLIEIRTLEHAKQTKFAPFRDLSKRALLLILRDAYNPEHYQPFDVTPELISYDAIQQLFIMSNTLDKKEKSHAGI